MTAPVLRFRDLPTRAVAVDIDKLVLLRGENFAGTGGGEHEKLQRQPKSATDPCGRDPALWLSAALERLSMKAGTSSHGMAG